MRGAVLTVLLALALGGCENPREEAIDKIDDDKEAVRKAAAAVNRVIRNSPDCTAAKPLFPEAYERIEEAHRVVSTRATHETLNMLKAQVDRVAGVCP